MEMNNQEAIPIQHKKPIPWQHIIYITSIFIIVFASVIIYYTNPVTIEHNNTVIQEVEVIREIEKECEVCQTCEVCQNCNDTQKYSSAYVLQLIRLAKKCEKSRYNYDLDECSWRLNRTDGLLNNCTEERDNFEDECEDFCLDIEWDTCKDMYDGNLTDCQNTLNICEDCLKDCNDDCNSDSNLGNCRECLDNCKIRCEDE